MELRLILGHLLRAVLAAKLLRALLIVLGLILEPEGRLAESALNLLVLTHLDVVVALRLLDQLGASVPFQRTLFHQLLAIIQVLLIILQRDLAAAPVLLTGVLVRGALESHGLHLGERAELLGVFGQLLEFAVNLI